MFSLDSRTYPEWADLPIELSAVIANHVTSIYDYISFRGVCKSWRSAATFDNFDRAFPRLPGLMYVTKEQKEENWKKENRCLRSYHVPNIVNFLDVSMNKTYKISDFPPTAERRYVSCRGWILSVWGVDVHLTHPVWRIRIELPTTNTFSSLINTSHSHDGNGISISKMVLSDSPTLKVDLVVMVIWGGDNQLGFSRPGDSSWTVIAASDDEKFSDIIYHNGRLYALDVNRRIVECDIHGPNPTQIRQVFSLPSYDPDFSMVARRCTWYLVETSGKFLIVARHFGTSRCRIFELDLKGGIHKEVDDLGNKALFLGCNSSLCVELSTWNEIKPNCIYFSDVNVYCLSDKGFHRFVYRSAAGSIPAPATWVMPSF
ncbi:hypothetical protein BUALT_Bualt10G0050100 [Buddleja alternifolia]|uniref:F-box protein n=1 Tax=Buddleja alternifolia TaxID=168488 RepID=A0AAV6WWZ1_9LAMI|nr:hypothetical protein BUALT_Bualt10G0050100 [Buddleja alternifolia]